MNYNYHTHTVRCGHASGTQEEYVQRAISCGIQKMGFSDHFPWRSPDGDEATWRVPVSEVEGYRAETVRLREKYKGQIEIFYGFEMEYYAAHFDEMYANAKSYGAEYLILGQHFILPEYAGGVSVFGACSDPKGLSCYVDALLGAMNTGAFTYIAHPDVFNYTDTASDVYCEEMRRVCRAAKQLNIPLELNLLGIRSKRNYPCESFWRIAGEVGAPVTFGFDAHDAPAAFDEASLPVAEDFVRRYRLNYIGEPSLISL